MQRKRYRRRRKYNAVRIFVAMVLLMVLLGFIVTQRGKHLESKDGNQQGVDTASEDQMREMAEEILADAESYP